MNAKPGGDKMLVCARCAGRGDVGRRVCPVCRGLGWGRIYGPFFLFWGRRVDDAAILLSGLKRILAGCFYVVLAAGTVLGLALGGQLAVSVQPSELLTVAFWQEPHRNLLAFWFGLICAGFLYYRAVVVGGRKEEVRRAAYGERPDDFVSPADADVWRAVGKLPRRRRVDVSRAYDRETLKAVVAAYRLARRFRHAQVEPVHVFAALLSTVKVSVMFGRLGLRFKTFKDQLSRLLADRPMDRAAAEFAPSVREVLLAAYVEAYGRNQPRVDAAGLFSAAVRADDRLQELLYEFNVDLQKIENVASWIRVQESVRRRFGRFTAAARYKPKSAMNRSMTAVATPLLDSLSHDLTSAAASGHFSPIIDRDREFEAILRAIEGGRKSVILVGEPGVGKEALLQGLAQKMVEEAVPEILQDKRLISLDAARLVSGATPAEAQERLLESLNEAVRAGNIVLAISGVAGLVGITAGGGESLDLSQVLAAELSRGRLFAIATATPREYAEVLENVPLGRALVKVDVPEADINQSIRILEAKAGGIEGRDGVFFSYDAVDAAVRLSARYLHGQFLPEKAIEIARETATAVRGRRGRNASIGREDVAAIMAEKTKIPLKALTEEESQRLLDLEKIMHGRVIGQDQAVKAVAAAMRRARADLRDKSRPIANFLFLGPTGVGKTELAKTLAEAYFGGEEAMIRLDMSEYQDKASLYRLIGEPGADRAGGILTEAVRQRPFSLLLLDEIEKADPDILNVFLQVMDDGRLTDNAGRVADFTSVILIATSNAGSQFIQDEIRQDRPLAAVKEGLLGRELKPYFRPEFLNRFDDIIVFAPLGPDEIERIARLMLAKVAKRLEDKGIAFEAEDAAVKELAASGYDPVFGARPLRRVIQDKVENPVADLLLQGRLGRRDRLILGPGGALRTEKADRL